MPNYPYGLLVFDSVFEVNGSCKIVLLPQRAFHGIFLGVPETLREYFAVTDFRVGIFSQFVDGTEVPCSIFPTLLTEKYLLNANATRGDPVPVSPDVWDCKPLTIDICRCAQEMSITVKNTSEAPRRFLAGLIGRV